MIVAEEEDPEVIEEEVDELVLRRAEPRVIGISKEPSTLLDSWFAAYDSTNGSFYPRQADRRVAQPAQ